MDRLTNYSDEAGSARKFANQATFCAHMEFVAFFVGVVSASSFGHDVAITARECESNLGAKVGSWSCFDGEIRGIDFELRCVYFEMERWRISRESLSFEG